MAAQPLRAICVLMGSGENVQDLARQLGDIVVKDKKEVAVASRRIERARVDLSTGKITVFSHSSSAFISKLADIATKTNSKSYLVKLGDASLEDTAKFAKVLSAKTEAEVKTIGAQLVDELYGKNAIPVTVKALPGKDVRVYGEYSGDVSLDALNQAFSTFGPVERVSLPNKHGVNVVFTKPEAAKAALEKKEVLCGTVSVKISKTAPRKPKAAAATAAARPNANGTKKSGESAKASDASAGSKAYMKIENVPEGVAAKEIKELYAKFGAEVADYNAQAKHCILRFSKPEGVAQASKEKITTKNGSELIAKPYSPKGSGKKSSKAKSNGSNGQAAPKAKTFRVLVDNADPAKCTKEQLEATFNAFKGFVSLSQVRSDASKYTVAYDNEASVQEICKAKEITCGSAKLNVRLPEPRERKARAIIAQPPADVTVEQVKTSVQALDAGATVEKGARSGDFLVDFSSKEVRDAVVAKDIKVGSHTLKFAASGRATRTREPKAEFGAFFTGLTAAQASDVTDALKPVCEVVKANPLKTGILVEVKSQKDEEKLLAASIKLKDGKTLKAEPLKRKGAN